MADSDNADEEPENDLTRWVAWLEKYMANLPALSGEKAIDFCEAAGDLWQSALVERPPVPDSAAALVLLEVARTFAQVTMAAALDERVSRAAAEASLLGALEGVRNDAQTWLDTGSPTAEVIAARVEAGRATFKQAQDAAANRIAEDEYLIAHPYGAILGYQDPAVEADIILTQVCEFTEDEHNRYAECLADVIVGRLGIIVAAPASEVRGKATRPLRGCQRGRIGENDRALNDADGRPERCCDGAGWCGWRVTKRVAG